MKATTNSVSSLINLVMSISTLTLSLSTLGINHCALLSFRLRMIIGQMLKSFFFLGELKRISISLSEE